MRSTRRATTAGQSKAVSARALDSGCALAAVLVCCSLAAVSCAPKSASPRGLRVAAAADLKYALDDLAALFGRDHPGAAVEPVYGSSGNFYSQIVAGAPFDVFLSADIEYPRRLLRDRIGVPDSLFTYAVGGIVVWVRSDSPLDPATALASPSLRKLAIANPAHAPYGRAAEAALRGLGFYESLEPRLVLGENVAQAFEFAASGAADAGVIARSLALAPAAKSRGRYWEIPPAAYPRIEQAGMIVRDSAGARDFRAFLLAPAAREILSRAGFVPPESR